MDVFERLGLTEYEQTALDGLLRLGRTTAPNLAEATGIPKARIYGVLDELADRGFVKVVPGRPKEYLPRSPEELLDHAVENRRQEYEAFERDVDEARDTFLAEYGPTFESATGDVRPAEELFHVVDVGDPSERETKRIYHEAAERVRVLSKSFEYLDDVEPALRDALGRGIDVRILLLTPAKLTDDERDIQRRVVERLDDLGVAVRFSERPLPWRGTFADPSMDYDAGEAILLVQEDEVPNHMRQAAITENGAFVAGLGRYFDLTWDHESHE